MPSLARILLILGILLIVAAGLVYLAARLGIQFGRLPGDFRIERGNFTCLIALGTSILLSVILTVVLNIIVRFLNK